MADKSSNSLFWLVVVGGTLLFFTVSLFALAFFFASNGDSSRFFLGSRQIAVLDVEGIIVDSKEFTEHLKNYGHQHDIKVIVLRLNSPGGGVAASQEMYQAVKKFRADTKKKVVVSMSSVAASGAYYVACAADKIFANPGSITGSIGVIAEWYNYQRLMDWAKLESIVIKSGPMKDAGSPTRPLTQAEKAYFQSLIDDMYDQFVSAVTEGRGMDEKTVRKLADGRVYTGEEANKNGLVDELGTFQDALNAAAKMAGITGEPRFITPKKKTPSLLDILLGDSRKVLSINLDRSGSPIRFAYLWR